MEEMLKGPHYYSINSSPVRHRGTFAVHKAFRVKETHFIPPAEIYIYRHYAHFLHYYNIYMHDDDMTMGFQFQRGNLAA